MFAHLPGAGYFEAKEIYNLIDPLASIWKPLRDFGLSLLVREKLDDLQMHVVIINSYNKFAIVVGWLSSRVQLRHIKTQEEA